MNDFQFLSISQDLEKEVEYFVWATGGGKVKIEFDSDRKRNCHCGWKTIATRELDAPTSFKNLGDTDLGFGRIEFADQAGHLMPYLRIPFKDDRATNFPAIAMSSLYYVENVWELPRPKLLISVTGGAEDFPLSRAKENVLYKLMEAARKTHAWIVTGGTDAGIMKYVGEPHS
jgi:transient receptor potential cation channel subfamily M protein 2